MTQSAGRVVGLLLAAGAGRRAGGPKALRLDPDGTSWLLRSVDVLLEGGCDGVIVVLGSQAEQARRLLSKPLNGPDGPQCRAGLTVVEAVDWAGGMGASLRAGLLAAASTATSSESLTAVVIHLVDLPDVTATVVRRLLDQALPGTGVLARATYRDVPGHPVLVGADHLRPMAAGLSDDVGAKAYLDRWSVQAVDCGDLATGRDRDWSDDFGLSARLGGGDSDA